MAGKKYYWLRLQRDFFKRHDIRIIEAMPNGKDYILFYLKLLVESIDHEGMLRFSDTVPYNEFMLATITNTNVDIVRSAMEAFKELKMVEVLEDSTIFMAEVDKMIGSSSGDEHTRESTRLRVQKHRALQKRYSNVTCNGEIEKEIEIDKEIDNNPPISPKGKGESVKDMALRLIDDYPMSESMRASSLEWIDYKVEKKNKYTEKGMQALFKKISAMANKYGDDSVIGLISGSMENNYQGIIWDKLVTTDNKVANRVSEVDSWL